MSISLELIEKLRQRANVSYAEAKAALEKCNGDLLEALLELEKENKIKTETKDKVAGFWTSLKSLIKKCNATHFVISKQNETVLNLSLTILIILTILAAPIVCAALLLALFTGHRFRLQKDGCEEEMKINKTFDDISTAASKVTDQVTGYINK